MIINHSEQPVLLLDLHNTISDFNIGFEIQWQKQHPGIPSVPLSLRNHPRVVDDYPPQLADQVKRIYMADGFIQSLPVVPGALEAIKELEKQYLIYICTKPSTSNPPAVVDKIMWISNHLGREWRDRVIIAEDKTLVRGKLLIDDAPEIKGKLEPDWEHILFDLPYNRVVVNHRRLNWENWRKIL